MKRFLKIPLLPKITIISLWAFIVIDAVYLLNIYFHLYERLGPAGQMKITRTMIILLPIIYFLLKMSFVIGLVWYLGRTCFRIEAKTYSLPRLYFKLMVILIGFFISAVTGFSLYGIFGYAYIENNILMIICAFLIYHIFGYMFKASDLMLIDQNKPINAPKYQKYLLYYLIASVTAAMMTMISLVLPFDMQTGMMRNCVKIISLLISAWYLSKIIIEYSRRNTL